MKYEEPEQLKKQDISKSFQSLKDINEISRVLISMSLYETDYDFIVEQLKSLKPEGELMRVFLIALSHVVRRFKKLDAFLVSIVKDSLNTNDELIKGTAEDTLDDIKLFNSEQ